MATSVADFLISAGVIIGLFFLAYTAYRQQGLIDTVNEIKEAFQDKAEQITAEGVPYK